jgi:hypothetical protein
MSAIGELMLRLKIEDTQPDKLGVIDSICVVSPAVTRWRPGPGGSCSCPLVIVRQLPPKCLRNSLGLQKNLHVPRASIGCPAWIRTMTKSSKDSCATITPPDNESKLAVSGAIRKGKNRACPRYRKEPRCRN